MSFWENVLSELEYQGLSRKELAYKADIKEQSLHKAIERNSSPSADTAVKIAKVLGVTVEYLVNGTEQTPAQKDQIQNQLRLYRKHHELITFAESLAPEKQKSFSKIVEELKEWG